jgi:hypothetical protein
LARLPFGVPCSSPIQIFNSLALSLFILWKKSSLDIVLIPCPVGSVYLSGFQTLSYEHYYPYGGTAIIAGKDKTQAQQKRYRYTNRTLLHNRHTLKVLLIHTCYIYSNSDINGVSTINK